MKESDEDVDVLELASRSQNGDYLWLFSNDSSLNDLIFPALPNSAACAHL